MTRQLTLVRDDTTATITALDTRRPDTHLTTLPDRRATLDTARQRAAEKALEPALAADMDEAIAALLRKLARKPNDLPGLLHDFGRRMYVTGRMDQADDDKLATAQAEAMVDASLAQVVSLIHPDGSDAA